MLNNGLSVCFQENIEYGLKKLEISVAAHDQERDQERHENLIS